MGIINGYIITGVYDKAEKRFSVNKMNNFSTQTVLNEKQINSLYYYLKSHQDDEDGQIVTLYDQMPVKLSQGEVKSLIKDFELIREMGL